MIAARTSWIALAAALIVRGEPGAPVHAPAPLVIHCTSDSIEIESQGQNQGKGQGKGQGKTQPQGKQKVSNPIAEALRKARPGTVIALDPGTYPPFTIGFQSSSPANAVTRGGVQGNPIVIEGKAPGVRIMGSEGDTIAIDQRVDNGWITFRNLEIVPGQRAGVMFYQRTDGKLHRGFTFEDCHILGRYDHATGAGKKTKWGVWGQGLADFRFAGVRAPARIENISEEHAFYLQNVQGAITIENVQAKDIGRTFCQFTARGREGPVGTGDVIVRNCKVEDACIARGDGFKGGSAFTICGRMECTFLFEKNSYRAGFRDERKALTAPGQPYGTGAFAAWEEGMAGKNGTVILRDNDFSFADGCGDRPVVSIGGCRRVMITGDNHFRSGGVQPALALDPVDGRGNPVSSANGNVYLAPATKIEGALTLAGKAPAPEELKLLQTREEPRKPADKQPAGQPPAGKPPADKPPGGNPAPNGKR